MRNDIVASLNDHILEQMYGDLRTYHSIDTANVNDEFEGYDELLVEYLHSLNLAGLLPAQLCLKVGTPVILLQNLYSKHRYCNSTYMIVTYLSNYYIYIYILGGDFDRELKLISKIYLTTIKSELPF